MSQFSKNQNFSEKRERLRGPMFVENSTSLKRYSMRSAVEEKNVSYNVHLVIAFILTIWIILFICVIFKIYKKFTGKIMPNHIFQMNLFTTFILKCFYLIFVYIHTMAILPGPLDWSSSSPSTLICSLCKLTDSLLFSGVFTTRVLLTMAEPFWFVLFPRS